MYALLSCHRSRSEVESLTQLVPLHLATPQKRYETLLQSLFIMLHLKNTLQILFFNIFFTFLKETAYLHRKMFR